MFMADKDGVPRRERDGLVSNVLLQAGDVPDTALTVTWVDMAVGSEQRSHAHDSEQIYVLVSGRGRMVVGAETADVASGELVQIPPGAPHAITNIGRGRLRYISASTPAVRMTDLYDHGDLAPA
jgi:mannose-6-phosphate isomerase-like protein (cupin superfamily)